MTKVTIAWKDGLPDDALERAQIEQLLTSSGLTSRYSAIKRLRDGSDQEALAELERISAEQGVEAARAAALEVAQGAPVPGEAEQEDRGSRSRSSRINMGRLKQDRGQGGAGKPGRFG